MTWFATAMLVSTCMTDDAGNSWAAPRTTAGARVCLD